MVTKIFTTAVLVLVSWITFANVQLQSSFNSLRHGNSQVQVAIENQAEKNQEIAEQSSEAVMEKFDTYIALQEESLEKSASLAVDLKSMKEQLQKKDSEVTRLKNFALLNNALKGVLQAEVFSMYQNSEAAAKALLDTKEAIYKSGGLYPSHKDTLRKLMGPIDSLAGSWKKGDHKKSSIEIRQTLQGVLNAVSS